MIYLKLNNHPEYHYYESTSNSEEEKFWLGMYWAYNTWKVKTAHDKLEFKPNGHTSLHEKYTG